MFALAIFLSIAVNESLYFCVRIGTGLWKTKVIVSPLITEIQHLLKIYNIPINYNYTKVPWKSIGLLWPVHAVPNTFIVFASNTSNAVSSLFPSNI